MNIAKNMEAIFVAALVLAGAATYANATVSHTEAVQRVPAVVKVTEANGMQTVTITAKRLTPAKDVRDGV